jgi:hypothetical protein
MSEHWGAAAGRRGVPRCLVARVWTLVTHAAGKGGDAGQGRDAQRGGRGDSVRAASPSVCPGDLRTGLAEWPGRARGGAGRQDLGGVRIVPSV